MRFVHIALGSSAALDLNLNTIEKYVLGCVDLSDFLARYTISFQSVCL